jgi:hypothetical protein
VPPQHIRVLFFNAAPGTQHMSLEIEDITAGTGSGATGATSTSWTRITASARGSSSVVFGFEEGFAMDVPVLTLGAPDATARVRTVQLSANGSFVRAASHANWTLGGGGGGDNAAALVNRVLLVLLVADETSVSSKGDGSDSSLAALRLFAHAVAGAPALLTAVPSATLLLLVLACLVSLAW